MVPARIARFFASRGWEASAFQQAAWAAWERGESGLIHVPTGSGKTYAATLAALLDIADNGGQLVYITPLKAMARSITDALAEAVDGMDLDLRVESRTGDTAQHVRARQKRKPPDVLLTTPESLCMLLSEADAPTRLKNVRCLILDEWHELLDSKRGTQCELAAARLRAFSSGRGTQTWALSATLSNVEEAARAAVGPGTEPTIIHADIRRTVELETLLPADLSRLPWSGHLGQALLPELLEWLDPARSTLVFVNTRAQAELWFQALAARRPEWAARLGIHHGSVDTAERQRVEDGLGDGTISLVVATASLDLGVDLAPVERVVQIGSPKGIGRLMQRAGRSGHRPGAASKVLCVPTHALQLVEIAAVRQAMGRGEVESRTPLNAPLDVLAQHLVTCALGGGFRRDAMLAEVRTAWSYRNLTEAGFDAALGLVTEGGKSLRAYPQFRKVVLEEEPSAAGGTGGGTVSAVTLPGVYRVPDLEIARMHRASIGTIVSDVTVSVRWHIGSGGRGTGQGAGRGGNSGLGQIDEGFIGSIPVGGSFHFAGRNLELVSLRDQVATVRPGKPKRGVTPHWPGNKLPISGSLGVAVRRVLDGWTAGAREDGPDQTRTSAGSASTDPALLGPEWTAVLPLLDEQARLSHVPKLGELLVEDCVSAEGSHLFLFPFEGRSVHEGLGALLALRFCRTRPLSLAICVNDFGMELLSPDPVDWDELLGPSIFTEEGLLDDILASVNATEIARRRFRDVARVAGFVNLGPVHRRNTGRQVQASASLLFDVFLKYDNDNPLLSQARREVLEIHFDEPRLRAALRRIAACRLVRRTTAGPTPLSTPLVEDRLQGDRASSQSAAQRLKANRDRATADEPAPPVAERPPPGSPGTRPLTLRERRADRRGR